MGSARRALALLALVAVTLAFPVAVGAGGAQTRSTIVQISAGFVHTCALTRGGGVKCWGANTQGQLGTVPRLLTHSTTPVDVTGLTNGIAAVTAGAGYSCARTRGGGVKCLGGGRQGQLGNGTTPFANRKPVDVLGLASGVSAIAAGREHACALTTAGKVMCWGLNTSGQLGNGSRGGSSSEPVEVAGLSSRIETVSPGNIHTCVLARGGGAKCWGDNLFGQLGSSATPVTGSRTPVDVDGLASGVRTISAAIYQTCALTREGGVKCWGSNLYGQLGNGTKSNARTPVDVVGLTSGVSAITAGDGHTCALTDKGGVKCWGSNRYGQLGNRSRSGSTTPVDVVGLARGVAAVSAGGNHTCALMRSGGVMCWGSNDFGQLGNGSRRASTVPIDVGS